MAATKRPSSRSSDVHGARCYAVRRLNPFSGVLQIVETDRSRAYSNDGFGWQIQVLTQRPDHTWRSDSNVEPVEQFFNFGLWDVERGLHRVTANPVLDIGAMQRAADALCALLSEHQANVPFSLTDRFECWSTDQHGKPVALLASSEDRTRLRDLDVGHWYATHPSDHSFVSPSLLERGIANNSDLGQRRHAEQLERIVRHLCQHKVWFERGDDGSGCRADVDDTPATLNKAAFPPLGLSTDWTGDEDRELVGDYLDWLAPHLLTLQLIADDERARLETAACRQATALAANHRLIPRIVDRQKIDAARVEARLRGDNT